MARLAEHQFGVVSLEQMRAHGISARQVERLLAYGHLHRLHRGVYAVGHRRVVDHAHLLAALLATGKSAFLSHRTAAAVWGLRVVAAKAIEVTVETGGRRNRLVVHRSGTVHSDEVTTRNGLRVSSVARLLVELAPRESDAELERLITQAVRKGIFRVEKVEQALARHTRRPGVTRLARAVAEYRPKPDRKSGLEEAFDLLLQRHPGIPSPQTNIVIEGWEIDCYWPEHRVALELDGRPYHVAVRDMEKDRLKDGKLLGMGIRPLRITDRRLEHDAGGALNDLLALLKRPELRRPI